MLTLYQPTFGATTTPASPSNGVASSEVLLLNILIELRVMNEILLGNAGTNSADSLRSDAVNETNNPVI